MKVLFPIPNMRRFSLLISSILLAFVWFTYAANPSIINYSYSLEGNDVEIFRTDNSNGWYIDINVQNPATNDWLHFGTVDISEWYFRYTKQRDWDQSIWMIPGDGWDEVKFVVKADGQISENENLDTTPTSEDAVRTVIPVAPKTWPSEHLIGIIIATLVIFGWYIYIKKRADI